MNIQPQLKYTPKNKRGSVLVVVVGVLAVLAMMAAAFLVAMQLQKAAAASTRFDVHAETAVKKGFNLAVCRIVETSSSQTNYNSGWHNDFLYSSGSGECEDLLEPILGYTDPYIGYTVGGGSTKWFQNDVKYYETGDTMGKGRGILQRFTCYVEDLGGKVFTTNVIDSSYAPNDEIKLRLSRFLNYIVFNNTTAYAKFASAPKPMRPTTIFQENAEAIFENTAFSTEQVFASYETYPNNLASSFNTFKTTYGFTADDCRSLFKKHTTPFGAMGDALGGTYYLDKCPAINISTANNATKNALLAFCLDDIALGTASPSATEESIIGIKGLEELLTYETSGTGEKCGDTFYVATDSNTANDIEVTPGPLNTASTYQDLLGVTHSASYTGDYFTFDILEALKETFNNVTPDNPKTIDQLEQEFLVTRLNAYYVILKKYNSAWTWDATTDPMNPHWVKNPQKIDSARMMEKAVNDVLNTFFRNSSSSRDSSIDGIFYIDFDGSSSPDSFTEATYVDTDGSQTNAVNTLHNPLDTTRNKTTVETPTANTNYDETDADNSLWLPQLYSNNSQYYRIIVRGQCFIRKKSDNSVVRVAEKNLESIVKIGLNSSNVPDGTFTVLSNRWIEIE